MGPSSTMDGVCPKEWPISRNLEKLKIPTLTRNFFFSESGRNWGLDSWEVFFWLLTCVWVDFWPNPGGLIFWGMGAMFLSRNAHFGSWNLSKNHDFFYCLTPKMWKNGRKSTKLQGSDFFTLMHHRNPPGHLGRVSKCANSTFAIFDT